MYIILEIQKFSETNVAVVQPVVTRSDPLEAESEFHRLASIAAVSEVPQHTVLFVDDAGNRIRPPESYVHPAAEE